MVLLLVVRPSLWSPHASSIFAYLDVPGQKTDLSLHTVGCALVSMTIRLVLECSQPHLGKHDICCLILVFIRKNRNMTNTVHEFRILWYC